MSGLRERLERLRAAAQASEAADAAMVAEAAGPDRSTASDMAEAAGSPSDDGRLHPAFRAIGVEEIENESGSFLLRRVVYPLPYRHGRYDLAELRRCAPWLGPVAARQNQSRETAPVDIDRLLFLDTETTGLGVGAGNVPFMIGIGYYTDRAFVVEQTLIRHPGEERAMLTYLLGHLMGRDHLVTYNGRTFDWPVIASRYIMNGWRKSGAEPSHLDFLHPSRALWRKSLASVRLSVVEEARLGYTRGEDVPGSQAPALYMQYLSDGNPSHLHGVYAHNEKDVLTLAALAVHFAILIEDRPEADEPDDPGGEETYCTACWLEKHGRSDHAERLFDRLAGRPDAGESAWSLALAARYKRQGNYGQAVALWQAIAEREERAAMPKPDVFVELAMHYEHRAKDYFAALQYARRALDGLQRRAKLIRAAASASDDREKLRRRIERLTAKLDREEIR